MTQSNPMAWGEMTPEEKGALLLAHHEGKEIQFYTSAFAWAGLNRPFKWFPHRAYRVKPEPQRETVRLLGYGTFANVLREDYITELDRCMAKYAITFDTIDGKPDCASIRMEALK